jgi:hypothetical protein
VGGLPGIILRPVEDHCEMPSPSVHSSPSVSTVSVIETPSVPLSPRVLPRQTAGTGQFSGWQIELKITLTPWVSGSTSEEATKTQQAAREQHSLSGQPEPTNLTRQPALSIRWDPQYLPNPTGSVVVQPLHGNPEDSVATQHFNSPNSSTIGNLNCRQDEAAAQSTPADFRPFLGTESEETDSEEDAPKIRTPTEKERQWEAAINNSDRSDEDGDEVYCEGCWEGCEGSLDDSW